MGYICTNCSETHLAGDGEGCEAVKATKATEGAVIDRLREAVTDWRAAAETHHKTSGKAMTQQRASYYEGKGDAYNACATALERAIWEIQRGE